MEDKNITITKRDVMGMGDLMKVFLVKNGLTSSYNQFLIVQAFEKCAAMKKYITNVYVINSMIYCTVSSSIIREQLLLNKSNLIENINNELRTQKYFIPNKYCGFIKDVIIK